MGAMLETDVNSSDGSSVRAFVGSPRRVTPPPAGSVSLSLLRRFELRVDDQPVEIPLGSQRVVAFVALARRRVGRIFLAGNLWIDSSEERAAAALRTALWRLGRPASAVVCAHGPWLSIDPVVEVDVDIATHSARQLLDQTDYAEPATALSQLRDDGDLLPDWYDDWVLIERERFRQLRLHALEALCHRLCSDGRYAQASEAGLAAVAAEPLRESAHRALIAVHLAEGNACEAVRQYRVCRDLLDGELGLEPSPQLQLQVAHLRT
jgi:DNA-binding SARP family transcriptional activator